VRLFATIGSEPKTNNGIGVAQGPDGKTCAKGMGAQTKPGDLAVLGLLRCLHYRFLGVFCCP
jgi:hypothetical protein